MEHVNHVNDNKTGIHKISFSIMADDYKKNEILNIVVVPCIFRTFCAEYELLLQ